MSKPRFAAVLFDLDGTLLDTAPDFITAINRLLESKGLPPTDPAETRNMVTHGSAGVVARAFQIDPTDASFEPLRQEFLDLYLDNLADRTRPFPGIDLLLEALDASQTPWGIVTNKPWLYTSAVLAQLPLPSSPAAVVCPDHVTRTKPDPESIYQACNTIKVNPKHCVYVGDHERDIAAGIAAGTKTIAAAYGYLDPDEDPANWNADHVVQNSEQLHPLIFA